MRCRDMWIILTIFGGMARGLLLYGPVGTGKTYYAACVVNALISKGHPALLNSLPRLINQVGGAKWEDRQPMIDHLADYTIRVAEQYVQKPHKRTTILNINAPCVEPSQLKEPVYAPLDTAFYLDSYEKRTSPRAGDYYWLESGSPIEPADEGSDNWYLERGHITLTIMGNYTCEPLSHWEALGID